MMTETHEPTKGKYTASWVLDHLRS